MQIIENGTFDAERAFYGSHDLCVRRCHIDGEADGESAFKECENITAEDCYFNLRYPFWHVHGLVITGSQMTELCRAALWYSGHITIRNTELHGIKALRECDEVELDRCDIVSPEFGWSSRGVHMTDCTVNSEYFLLRGRRLRLGGVRMTGKYSFQYIEDAELNGCELDTKDAFWHASGVKVTDSVISGEYLAWYSNNLTLERCTIIGTQPFCYCSGLRLIDCRMLETDLSFEKSGVQASVTTPILSVKNPRSGRIEAPAIGEIIRDDPNSAAQIIVGQKD